MSETARLGLPLIAAAQAQKHVTHNEALARLDTLAHLRLIEERQVPPATAGEGDTFLVASGAWGALPGTRKGGAFQRRCLGVLSRL
ncbi:DUF2793 domain-containing protein [Pannonibacter sp. Pt2-lr]